jgi:hypothetical protein
MTIAEILAIVPRTLHDRPLAIETAAGWLRVRAVRVDTSDAARPIVLVPDAPEATP